MIVNTVSAYNLFVLIVINVWLVVQCINMSNLLFIVNIRVSIIILLFIVLVIIIWSYYINLLMLIVLIVIVLNIG